MSSEHDTTRIVRSWLNEGVTQLPDRVLDAVLDQVPTTPQRRATWWPVIQIGLAAALLAVAAFLGINYLGDGSGVGGPGGASPTPTASPSPVPPPTATLAGLLPEGPHVLAGQSLEGMPSLPTTITIPGADWYGAPGGGVLTKSDNDEPPDGAGLIIFFGEFNVYRSPCNWATTRPNEPATTVDEVIDRLVLQVGRDASDPADIALNGYAGKAITLHVPDDAVFDDCDLGVYGSWGMPGEDRLPFRYQQGPGQIDEVWVIDVNGMVAIIDWAYYAGTPQTVVDELRDMVQTITFEAP